MLDRFSNTPVKRFNRCIQQHLQQFQMQLSVFAQRQSPIAVSLMHWKLFAVVVKACCDSETANSCWGVANGGGGGGA